jgi:RimJ/RimL family protein N-acetyltransferase
VIETERLLLRRFTTADVDDFVALYGDPEVRRFIAVSDDFGPELARRRIEADQTEWDQLGHRMLVMIERSSGRFLGRVALYDWPQFGEIEVGWALRADARGHGFATEAARAVANWGFEHLRPPYLTAMIKPINEPSIGVAERLGMSTIRDEVLHGVPVIVYAVDRDRWTALVQPMA